MAWYDDWLSIHAWYDDWLSIHDSAVVGSTGTMSQTLTLPHAGSVHIVQL